VITVTYVRDDEPTSPGLNGAKVYDVKIDKA
jgi:hypothetical protein